MGVELKGSDAHLAEHGRSLATGTSGETFMRNTLFFLSLAAGLAIACTSSASAVPISAAVVKEVAAIASSLQPARWRRYRRWGWWGHTKCYREFVIGPYSCHWRAQWAFGMSTYAFESPGRLICCFLEDGKWNLAQLHTRTKRFDPIPTRFTDISQLRASPGRVVFIGGTPTEPSALIDLDLNTRTDRVVRRSAHLSEEVRSCVSRPEFDNV